MTIQQIENLRHISIPNPLPLRFEETLGLVTWTGQQGLREYSCWSGFEYYRARSWHGTESEALCLSWLPRSSSESARVSFEAQLNSAECGRLERSVDPPVDCHLRSRRSVYHLKWEEQIHLRWKAKENWIEGVLWAIISFYCMAWRTGKRTPAFATNIVSSVAVINISA